jgi:nucleoside-diphosphate-sugar epimerase
MRNYIDGFFTNLVGQKIMIAGFNGYIGTELVSQLELNNIPYTGIDKTPSTKKNCLDFNLFNRKQVIDIISTEKPDYFYHMATHSALAYKNDFLNVFHEDTVALHNIISGLKNNNNTRLIYFSSSYVYSGLEVNNTVNEKTILNPSHNFGLAKSFFEQMILRVYSNSVIFRLSSVFGKGKYLHPNAIEVMAQEAMNDKLLTIWGKGTRKMQYIFLEDVVKYILKAPELQSGIYNLSGHGYDTVMATANHIAEYFGVKTKILPDKKEGETLPLMDNKKVIDILDQDYFSDHNISLTQYLADISN